jgi:hypothetical protein
MTRQVPTGTKWCASCATALPLASFGVNKARHDGLQSRCKSCRNAVKNETDAAKREAARQVEVESDLDAIAAEVQALEIGEAGTVPMSGPAGFASIPVDVLAVPRVRGRWPAKYGADVCAASNWCALIEGASLPSSDGGNADDAGANYSENDSPEMAFDPAF